MYITCDIKVTNPISSTIAGEVVDGYTPPNVADAARELGLKPVRAWVPDETKREGTAGARRTRRSREKAEQHGLKQLSVTLPVELHAMVKTLAARTKAGEAPETVMAELLPAVSPLRMEGAAQNIEAPTAWLDSLPAWRRWLLRWLLPAMNECRMP
jgi:hypothetical protein